MNVVARPLAAAAIIAALAGCSTGSMSQWSANDEPLAAIDNSTAVVVENHNWADVVVYAERNGDRRRLGMVTSMTSSNFQLPRGMRYGGDGVHLVAEPIAAGGRFVTGPISVAPGQQVRLRIENQLSISQWTVR